MAEMQKILYDVIIFMKRNYYCHENTFLKIYSNVCKALFYNT